MFGSLSKLAMSLGRELFGLNVKSNQKLADIAKQIGIDTDDIASASDEAIQATLETAARSGVIDPREANAITIQIAKDAQEVVPDRSFVEGYEGNQVLPKVGGGEDPDYVYRTMSKKEYEDFINKGELVNVGGRTHASASPLNEFSNNVDDTVTVKIKYDRNDGWKAKMSSLGEVYAVTDQPISSEKISLVGALPKDAQPTLKVDNPNEDWLASKIRFAERSKENAPPNTYRANLGNSDGVTGYFSKPIEIDPNMLVDVRGSMGEESFRPDARKMQDLRESIAEGGYEASPILIHVREDGVPFVVEGNHRIIEGIESGRSTIPVELKYLRGSEDIEDGILSPTNLGVKR